MRERPKEIVSVISKGAGTGILFLFKRQQTRTNCSESICDFLIVVLLQNET